MGKKRRREISTCLDLVVRYVGHLLGDVQSFEGQFQIFDRQPFVVRVPPQPLKSFLGRFSVRFGQRRATVSQRQSVCQRVAQLPFQPETSLSRHLDLLDSFLQNGFFSRLNDILLVPQRYSKGVQFLVMVPGVPVGRGR